MFTRASRPGLACRSRALYWSSVASKLSRHSRSDSGVIGLKESVLSGSYVHQNPTGGSRWIVQSQATEDTKDFPQSHRRQPVDRSVPSFVSRYWTRAGIERSTGCRRWDSRAFLAPCRPGLNDPPAAASGIPESQSLCRNFSCPVCVLSSPAVIASCANHPSALDQFAAACTVWGDLFNRPTPYTRLQTAIVESIALRESRPVLATLAGNLRAPAERQS